MRTAAPHPLPSTFPPKICTSTVVKYLYTHTSVQYTSEVLSLEMFMTVPDIVGIRLTILFTLMRQTLPNVGIRCFFSARMHNHTPLN